MKYWMVVIMLLCILLTAACQEISIQIEMPEKMPDTTVLGNIENTEFIPPTLESNNFMITPTNRVIKPQTPQPLPTFTPTQTPLFDPASPLLTLEDLPAELGFTGGDLKLFNTSYLYSPGRLAGIAYVREYVTVQGDLFFTEILIYSPVQITPEIIRAGYWGSAYQPVDEKLWLGDYSLSCQRVDNGNTVGFRFSENNMMVVLTMAGEHPYKTIQNLYSFAQKIYDGFPHESIDTPTMPLLPVLKTENRDNFQSIQLTECEADNPKSESFVNGDQGICFSIELTELNFDLKAGIYNPEYAQLFYLTEFQSFFRLGQSNHGLFRPVTDFGWQHLPAGEYQALFWVEGDLVAVLPFTFTP